MTEPPAPRYIAESREIEDEEARRFTLVGLRAKKRKAAGDVRNVKKQNQGSARARGFFAPDRLQRVLRRSVTPSSKYGGLQKRQYSGVLDADKQRCLRNMAQFFKTKSWQTFLHGTEVEGDSTPVLASSTDMFVKRTTSSAEIEIAAALHCITVAKGLPPFVLELQGFQKLHGEFRVSVTKSKGRSMQKYLDDRLALNQDLHLDAILTQVYLALRSFQKYAGFAHNDLHTKNIIIEERDDFECYVAHVDGQIFSFPPNVPFVRLVDFGQSAIVHPLRDRTCSSVFTGPIIQDVSCADVSKLMVCLVGWGVHVTREGGDRSWVDVLGENVAQDVRMVMRCLTNGDTTNDDIARYVATGNKNSEYFPMELGTSLDVLIREGSCAAKFSILNPDDGRCSFVENIFYERDNDVFCSQRPIARFRNQAATSHTMLDLDRKLVPLATNVLRKFFETIVSPSLETRGVVRDRSGVPVRKYTMGSSTVFHFQQTDEFLRRRVAWKMLELYQRGVLLYLKLFVARGVSGHAHTAATKIRGEIAKLKLVGVRDDERDNDLLLVVSLIAVTGDYEPFFSRDIVVGKFNAEHHDENMTVCRAARKQAMKIYDRVRFGTERDGLCVPAKGLTHTDVYEGLQTSHKDDFSMYHFHIASNPLFYGTAK